MNDLFKQIIKFGVVGGLAFIIDYALLYILTEYGHIDVLFSSTISFSVSVIFNYICSLKWVFNPSQPQHFKDFIFFVILSVVGLGINQLIMWFGINQLGIYYMLVKLLATAIVMIYNFITRKIFLFK